MEKILIVSHCILNKASKVAHDDADLQEEYRVRSELMKRAMEEDIQLIQLPCPEFILYGSRRWGHVRDQFDHPGFCGGCREMFRPVLLQIKEYLSDADRFRILGIVSVEGSPSCGWRLTCRGEWGGEFSGAEETERKLQSLRMEKEPGIFMREIAQMLREEQITLPILSMEDAIETINSLTKEKKDENK